MTLYGSRFVDLARAGRGGSALAEPTVSASAANALCGDEIEVALRVEGGVIREAAYRERGCAMLTVSAAILARTVAGLTVAEARDLASRLDDSLCGPTGELPAGFEAIGPARLLPTRRRCVLLPWDALHGALDRVPA